MSLKSTEYYAVSANTIVVAPEKVSKAPKVADFSTVLNLKMSTEKTKANDAMSM